MRVRIIIAMAALLLAAGSAIAQINNSSENANAVPSASANTTSGDASAPSTTPANPQEKVKSKCAPGKMQNFRPTNQCGVNMFEPPKDEGEEVPFDGLKLDWGAAFWQAAQSLRQRNTAASNVVSGVNQNQLMQIGTGFNYAVANLYLNAQLADGIRMALTVYLSARHHQETWVKDGYVQIDKLPLSIAAYHGIANTLFDKYITVKVGHMEINYGDAHFRRTDNGNGVYNPFIGNYLMDAFTTEIGAEVYARANGALAMFSMTGGEIHGDVLTPQNRAPAFISKLGFDKQLTPNLRVRLTGSNYTIRKSASDTLYGGDRGGSPYYFAMENTQATTSGQAFSGTINPGFSYKVTAYMVNPFIKYKGLEFFGVAERATGRSYAETRERTFNQIGGEIVYRFADDHLFFGGRYSQVRGNLANMINQVSVNRSQIGAGWFLNKYLLMKGEYVVQNYKNFPTTDIRNGGRFRGPMIDAVLAF